jgi:hypothetical protein
LPVYEHKNRERKKRTQNTLLPFFTSVYWPNFRRAREGSSLFISLSRAVYDRQADRAPGDGFTIHNCLLEPRLLCVVVMSHFLEAHQLEIENRAYRTAPAFVQFRLRSAANLGAHNPAAIRQ